MNKLTELFLGKSATDSSPATTLNKTDWKKILVHAVIVSAAAGITVLAQHFANLDLGSMNAIVVPLVSSVLITIQKYLKDNDPGE